MATRRPWRLSGSGRRALSDEEFAQHVHEVLGKFGPEPAEGPWDECAPRLRFAGGGFSADDPGSMLDVLGEARELLGDDDQHVHYLALPPSTFAGITRGLAAHGLAEGARVVDEKPDGTSPGPSATSAACRSRRTTRRTCRAWSPSRRAATRG